MFLVCLTWLVFAQTLSYEFVNYDDETYVYRNPDVIKGLTPKAVVWAFTHAVAANWHPLTVISHMLDCAMYGLSPAGHHFTNVLLHSVAAILVFLALNRATGALWRSAFVSGVFAIHPVHVESVAWVSERKDVLSGVFFMLTLLGYVAYSRKRSFGRYLVISILFALGLMSKPMLVTLPFVLLLLDYWPLNRSPVSPNRTGRQKHVRDSTSQPRPMAKLFLEKVPLIILSIATCVVALVTQSETKSVAGMNLLSLPSRIGNASVAYAIYVWQMIWPRNLAVFYPLLGCKLPAWEIALSIAFLAIISFGALLLRKRCPYLFTGWFWYVGMLAPVIGIVQVGQQAHADRYTYLPQIGLYLAITWAVADISRSWRHRQIILTVAATAVLSALIWWAWIQTSYWRDSESLWRHAAAVTPDNAIVTEHLADGLPDKVRVDEAIAEARHGLTFRPVTASALSMLGVALTRRGELDEALSYLRSAIELDPKLYLLHYNLGNVLFQKGQVDEAIAHYKSELDTHSGFAEAHNNLGNALLNKGDPDGSARPFEEGIGTQP